MTITLEYELVGMDGQSKCCSISNATHLTQRMVHQISGWQIIQRIKISGDINEIGNDAFSKCYHLESVSLSDSITVIGEYAFYRCAVLESVNMPEHLRLIGKAAFTNCKKLKALSFSSSLAKIEASAFYGCSALTDVVLPDGLLALGDYAFYQCASLRSICIPPTVLNRPVEWIKRSTNLRWIELPQQWGHRESCCIRAYDTVYVLENEAKRALGKRWDLLLKVSRELYGNHVNQKELSEFRLGQKIYLYDMVFLKKKRDVTLGQAIYQLGLSRIRREGNRSTRSLDLETNDGALPSIMKFLSWGQQLVSRAVSSQFHIKTLSILVNKQINQREAALMQTADVLSSLSSSIADVIDEGADDSELNGEQLEYQRR